MTYFNTNSLSGHALIQAERQAASQEDEVLLVFHAAGRPLAPHEVQMYSVNLGQAPLTSVRRAMSNLVKEGELVRCAEMVDGPFGKSVHQWRLVDRDSVPLGTK